MLPPLRKVYLGEPCIVCRRPVEDHPVWRDPYCNIRRFCRGDLAWIRPVD